jgi:hypothetical protein
VTCDDWAMSERLSMRKIREVLRLAHSGRSQREIAIAIRASVGTVWNQLQRAKAANITWTDAQELTDEELNELLFAKGSTQPSQLLALKLIVVIGTYMERTERWQVGGEPRRRHHYVWNWATQK